MVAYLRQFLVALLVLLQVLAPLVHAHVGDDVSKRGLHLHEFDAWQIGHGDDAGLMAPDQDLQSQNGIINLGSAIKRQQWLDKLAPVLCLLVTLFWLAAQRQAVIVSFSPHRSRFVPEPLPSHNSSRAPPF